MTRSRPRANHPRLSVVLAFSTLLLGACGGGGSDGSGPDGDGPTCAAISGNVSFTAGASCLNCTSSDNGAAADGDFRSYATMTEPATSAGEVSLRVTRTDGGTFAGGTPAGVVFGFDGAAQNGITLNITTYRAGVMQETQSLETDTAASYANNTHSYHSNISTTLPFDAVEYNYTRTVSGNIANARVYALCSS